MSILRGLTTKNVHLINLNIVLYSHYLMDWRVWYHYFRFWCCMKSFSLRYIVGYNLVENNIGRYKWAVNIFWGNEWVASYHTCICDHLLCTPTQFRWKGYKGTIELLRTQKNTKNCLRWKGYRECIVYLIWRSKYQLREKNIRKCIDSNYLWESRL